MADFARLDDALLPEYLRSIGVLGPREAARIEPAGDGNINWVRRVRLDGRSFVVKQARRALERFPEYEAPTERIVCEARYYERVRPLDAACVCPSVLRFDDAMRVLILEDLGDATRLDAGIAGGADRVEAAARIGRFLGAVHAATAGEAALADRFSNEGMRRLHGDHIFLLPFHENDFPLPPAVRARAEAIAREGRVTAIAAEAYRAYLAPGDALVHGDVQAGNVLLAARGAVLLDAEIAHVGDPAFDLGTLFAHLWLPDAARGEPRRAESSIDAALHGYRGGNCGFDAGGLRRARRYAGLEMLRRTLGAARVAAVADPDASLRVIDFALPLL